MRREALLFLVLKSVQFLTLINCQHAGEICDSDSDCYPWLTCFNDECTPCRKVDTMCDKNSTGYLSQCCDGTTCELIPGFNGTSRCKPNRNKCLTDANCSGGLSCLLRLGKCGICNQIGTTCKLPYDTLECCSSYCRLSNDGISGTCADPRNYNRRLFLVVG
jgi:hypothetical protein